MWKPLILLPILILAAGSPLLFGQGVPTQNSHYKANPQRPNSNRRTAEEAVSLDELSWLIGDWGSNGDRAVATRASGGHHISDLTIARDVDGRLLVTYIYTNRRGNAAVRYDAFQHVATWNEKRLQFQVETRRIDATRGDDGGFTFDAEELRNQSADKYIISVKQEVSGSNWWTWSLWIKRPGTHEFSRFRPLPAVRGERNKDLSWEELLLKFPRPLRFAHYPYDTITPHSGFGPIRLGRTERN